MYLRFLEFSLTKWEKIVFNTGTWQQLSYFKILQIHLQKKQEQKRKICYFFCYCQFPLELWQLRLQRILIRAKETLHLISLAQSLFTPIPSLLHIKKKPTQAQKNTFLFFFLISIAISHCKNTNNLGNPVNTEKKRSLCLTVMINKKKRFPRYF